MILRFHLTPGTLLYLIYAFETHEFGYRGIGMLTVKQSRIKRLHPVQQPVMTVTPGGIQVLFVAKDTVGIGQKFHHPAMFDTQNRLQLAVRQIRNDIHAPIGQLAVHAPGRFVIRIHPRVPQTGQHFMDIIERAPATVLDERCRVTFIKLFPHVGKGFRPHVTAQTFRIVVGHVLAILQDTQHVLQPLFQTHLHSLIRTCSIGQRKGGHVVRHGTFIIPNGIDRM